MDIVQLVKSRPFLYHLTAPSNLPAIRAHGALRPAAEWLRQAGRPNQVRTRRMGSVTVHVDGHAISLRDQDVLHQGNIDFLDGWSFDRLLESLNSRVFFWPGTREGPIDYGLRHLERYRGESPAMLRTSFAHLLLANSALPPLLCRYNSGSPRCSGGFKSPRGPDTFVGVESFRGSSSSVVEVTFLGETVLPANTEVSRSQLTGWTPLSG